VLRVWFRRGSLFQRTAMTIAGVSLLFLAITLAGIAYFILIPTGQRSASELAAMLQLATESWQALPDERLALFRQRLEQDYQIRIHQHPDGIAPLHAPMPFIQFVQQRLSERLGEPLEFYTTETSPGWYWVEIPLRGHSGTVWAGFHYVHEGIEPPHLLLVLVLLGGLFTMLTSLALAHRVLNPLERLTLAARDIGSGGQPKPLPEQGPIELAELARTFNQMATQVQELLANRTTLLAGISHDLRTPMARIQLALAMLPLEEDHEMVAAIRHDLQQMDRLVGLFLEISRGLQAEEGESVELMGLLDEIVTDARRSGHPIQWQPMSLCSRHLRPLALSRIVTNLLENAIRYGGSAPIEVHCTDHSDGLVVIEVLDRGPGIPPDESEAVFRPFHRLERSRSQSTGGSGLGLSIARQLADANGYRLELQMREGGGTRALLAIPAPALGLCAPHAEGGQGIEWARKD